jgi:hypothetical protein
MLAIGVCASLAAGSLGFAGGAEARMPPTEPRDDELSFYCGMYQDQYDEASDKLKRNPKDATALADLNRAVDNWYDNNCDDKYGILSFRVAVQTPTNNQQSVRPSGGVSPQTNPQTQVIQNTGVVTPIFTQLN